MHLDHGEEAVRVLLVAVASVQPGQQQVKGVAELVTVASPDLKRNHIRKFGTLMDSCKMIRFSIERSYSG